MEPSQCHKKCSRHHTDLNVVYISAWCKLALEPMNNEMGGPGLMLIIAWIPNMDDNGDVISYD